MNHDDARFLQLRESADESEAAVKRAVDQACPSQHNPVQHRDGRPPWCVHCGRDARGRRWSP